MTRFRVMGLTSCALSIAGGLNKSWPMVAVGTLLAVLTLASWISMHTGGDQQ